MTIDHDHLVHDLLADHDAHHGGVVGHGEAAAHASTHAPAEPHAGHEKPAVRFADLHPPMKPREHRKKLHTHTTHDKIIRDPRGTAETLKRILSNANKGTPAERIAAQGVVDKYADKTADAVTGHWDSMLPH